MLTNKLFVIALGGLLALAACGGGGGIAPTTDIPPLEPEQEQDTEQDTEQEQEPEPDARLSFPRSLYDASGIYTYSAAGLPDVSGGSSAMPIYHDGLRLMVGVDQGAQHVGNLPSAGERHGFTIRYGRLDDGVGLDTVRRYLSQTVDLSELRYTWRPIVRFGGDVDQADIQRVIRAVQLVNVALPENQKMVVARDWVGTPDPTSPGIYLDFKDHIPGGYWGITYNSNSAATNQVTHSRILINKQYTSNGDRQATILLAHEMLHALGMFGGDGHVSELEFDSILEGGQYIYAPAQGIPQPLSLLYPVDREAMRALYSGLLDGASPSTFGPWESTSIHIVGVGERTAFGVRVANGYASRGPTVSTRPRPWWTTRRSPARWRGRARWPASRRAQRSS